MPGMTALQSARAGQGRQRWPENSVIAAPGMAFKTRHQRHPLCPYLMPLRALRRFDDHDIVVMAGVPLQALAPHADLVAHQFIAELERIQPVAGDGAVAQPDYDTSQDGFEFVLQFVDRLDRKSVV